MVDEERTSPGEDSEEMERGQEMERLIGPGRVGEEEGAGLLLRDFTGCFQSIRPVYAKKREREKERCLALEMECSNKTPSATFVLLISAQQI